MASAKKNHKNRASVYFRYLENTLDERKIRSQDILTVLSEVSRNPGGQLAAWRMVRKHWDTIAYLFGKGSFTLGAIIKSVTSHFSTEFDLAEVRSFCLKQTTKDAEFGGLCSLGGSCLVLPGPRSESDVTDSKGAMLMDLQHSQENRNTTFFLPITQSNTESCVTVPPP